MAADESSRLRISHSKISSLLGQQTVTTVKRDNIGFLWIGTQQGLFRYDGDSLIAFSSSNLEKYWVPSSDIQQVEIGSNGDIWVATFGGGVAKYDPKSESFWPVLPMEQDRYLFVTSMFSTPEGNIWLGTRDAGIVAIKNESGEIVSWLDSHPLNSNIRQSTEILQDSAGNIWIGSTTGLYKIDPTLEQMQFYPVPAKSNTDSKSVAVKSLELDTDGIMWVGTQSGVLYQFNLDSRSFVPSNSFEKLGLGSVEDISIGYGKIWVATDLGLFAIDKTTSEVTIFSEENSFLSNDHVTSLDYDGEVMWIGTYFGLNLISKTSFDTFNSKNSGISNEVLSFSSDARGRTWVATYGGIYFFDSNSRTHRSLQWMLPQVEIEDQRIMSVAAKGENLWIGFRHNGIQIVDLATGRSKRPGLPIQPNFAITKILHSSDGVTWIGTYFNGLFCIKDNVVVSYYPNDSNSQPDRLRQRSITALLESKDGRLLIGTESGAYEFNKLTEHFTPIRLDAHDGSSDPTVLSISESNDGSIWLGTKDHGFFFQQAAEHSLRLPLNGSDHFTSNAIFNTIYGIEFDSRDHAWMSTARGLLEVGRTGQILRRFSTTDGLQGNDFNYGASHKDSKGRLYFGGSNGYNRFNPDDVKVDSPPPPIVFTGLKIAGREPQLPVALRDLELIELPHNDYYITLIFSALDFIDPAKNQFSYKLENFDPEWIDNSTRNSATYTSLPAGDYIFRVRGANSAGIWNMEGTSVRIRVLPAPWLTWWAYLGYAMIALVVFLLIKRVYDDHLITKKARIMAQDMSNAADRANDDLQEQLEIQDELVRSVHRHNIDTLDLLESIISLQSEIPDDKQLRQAIGENPNRVLALTHLQHCMIYHGDALFADFSSYVDSIIGLLLKTCPVPAESIMTINEVGNRLTPIEIATPLALMSFELLRNSIDHAFEQGSHVNYLQISLEEDGAEQLLTLTVKDSGIGLPENFTLSQGDFSGLSIVEMIVNRLGGQLEFSNPEGTCVSITIPIVGGLFIPLAGIQKFQA